MANLKLIKDIAAIKGITIEELASRAQVSTQAIHLMGRSGKTKMETLETIADILEVPAYVFFDDNFDVGMFRDYVVQGHHNPTSFFGPIYNGGDMPFPQTEKEAELKDAKKMVEEKEKENHDLVKAKDETIRSMQAQIDDLRSDKEYFRNEATRLRAELDALRNGD